MVQVGPAHELRVESDRRKRDAHRTVINGHPIVGLLKGVPHREGRTAAMRCGALIEEHLDGAVGVSREVDVPIVVDIGGDGRALKALAATPFCEATGVGRGRVNVRDLAPALFAEVERGRARRLRGADQKVEAAVVVHVREDRAAFAAGRPTPIVGRVEHLGRHVRKRELGACARDEEKTSRSNGERDAAAYGDGAGKNVGSHDNLK